MARGDKHGLHPCPRAQDRAHSLAAVRQPRIGASFLAHGSMLSDKSGLSAADRREIEKKSHMGTEAEAARMGDSLAIEEYGIGSAPEHGGRFEQNGSFPLYLYPVYLVTSMCRPTIMHQRSMKPIVGFLDEEGL